MSYHFDLLESNMHWNKHLQSSFNKYGIDNFEFKIVEECKEENLNSRERYWISFYDSNNREHGFNMTSGGESESGWTRSEETKHKLSRSMMGNKGISGMIYINNGSIEKIIKPDKLPEYEAVGFKRGPMNRPGLHNKRHITRHILYESRCGPKNPMYGRRGTDSPIYGRVSLTNGTESVCVDPSEVDKYISAGWHTGRDKECCNKLSKAVSDVYDYNGETVYGLKSILEDLHNKGIMISKCSLTRMSHGEVIRGYESLFGQVKLLQHRGQEPFSKEELDKMFSHKKVEDFPAKRKGCPKYGEDNPFYGKHHSKETKDILRNKCGHTNNKHCDDMKSGEVL
jgi:group I intron endonuclease